MNTHALPIALDRSTYETQGAESRLEHPLLKVIAQAEHGRLMFRTPEGQTHYFGHGKGIFADMRIYNWDMLNDTLARGELGFAESYMKGCWETTDLTELLTFLLANSSTLEQRFAGSPWRLALARLKGSLQSNTLPYSKRNAAAHYDTGNDFFRLWLDKSMTYSCALFGGRNDIPLELAQAAKYARILRKLGASPNDHILEIGGGWGGFAEAAARKGYRVTSITVSEEERNFAKARIREAGLDHLVTIELRDYRQLEGMYDHIVSINMFEHVGERFWSMYFETIRAHLKPGGKAMIQSIVVEEKLFERTREKQGFIDRYIFPGSALLTKARFCAEAENAGLRCADLFAFGEDYVITLREWLKRFEEQQMRIYGMGYDERFIRMWKFYLSASIAAFNQKRMDVIQIELS